MVASRSILGLALLSSLALASGGVACQLAYPLDDLPGSDSGVDSDSAFDGGSAVDARPSPEASTSGDADAADAPIAIDASPFNGDFEQNTPGECAAFNAYNAVASPTTATHSGKSACLVCAQSSGATFSIGGGIASAPVPPGHYFASAWVRSGPDNEPSVNARLNLRVMCLPDAGMQDCLHFISDASPTASTYRQLVLLDEVVDDSVEYSEIDVYVSVDDGVDAGECMLVDDFNVYRE